MGLDMYLTRKCYVQNCDHYPTDKRCKVIVRQGGKLRENIKPERVCYVIEKVAYWRKANAIHKWFVANCQNGNDDCGEYYVSNKQLAELVAACKRVLDTVETVDGDLDMGTTYYPDGRVEHHKKPGQVVAQKEIAAATLPTQDGFFFGGTDYDEFYLDDLRETVEQIEPLIADDRESYYYNSSW
jgi:hypothetical protein